MGQINADSHVRALHSSMTCVCGLLFSSSASLFSHISYVHMSRSFACRRCGVGFTNVYAVEAHYQQFHQGR